MKIWGKNRETFELSIIRYDQPGVKNDDWDANLLRASIWVHCANGMEGANITLIHTVELSYLENWLKNIYERHFTSRTIDFYYGRFSFELLEIYPDGIQLQVNFDFSTGKGSRFPSGIDARGGWTGSFVITNSFDDLLVLINSLQEDISTFPRRILRNKKKKK